MNTGLCVYLCGFLYCLGVVLGVTQNGCPNTWRYWNSACYQVFMDRRNHSEAEKVCLSYDGHLTSVRDPAENKFLSSEMSKGVVDNNFWIGLVNGDNNTLQWLDGSPFLWNVREELNLALNLYPCRLLANEFWTASPCSYPYHYICKVPGAEITTEYITTTPAATTTTTTTQTTTTTTTPTTTTTTATTTPTTEAPTTTTSTTTVIPTVPTTATSTATTTATSPLTFPTTTISTTTTKPEATTKNQYKEWKTRIETSSIPDSRPSAVGIGVLGIIILVGLLLGILITDLPTFYKHVNMMIVSIKSNYQYRKEKLRMRRKRRMESEVL